jgi:hypothetical protein
MAETLSGTADDGNLSGFSAASASLVNSQAAERSDLAKSQDKARASMDTRHAAAASVQAGGGEAGNTTATGPEASASVDSEGNSPGPGPGGDSEGNGPGPGATGDSDGNAAGPGGGGDGDGNG